MPIDGTADGTISELSSFSPARTWLLGENRCLLCLQCVWLVLLLLALYMVHRASSSPKPRRDSEKSSTFPSPPLGGSRGEPWRASWTRQQPGRRASAARALSST
mmetsp:Transcript_16292/g.31605  ORF Transcript_16292/g.31605 Transcript_16292/m.31605 type:complete len:104 (-) Transcript_16292:622-933(-)